ncbi:amino acid permease [Nostoc ellipsosporum NOK]|uniref:APC family permease n=1 Tax=Sphingomonas sp. IBVSS2 TaxID=1985172 RepID=UPI0015C50E82|nr:amino acid permease [Sphingomonas sp. IBVSS2]MDF2385080.1 amino acid permease [Nostoc ellipsosporum NOK]
MTESRRPFGFWTATALVIGNMIGSGFFALPAQLAPYGFTSVAAWIAAIAGAMVIAWVIAGLSRAMPEATGTLAICARALGPLPGVLIAWTMWVGVWAANAFIALTAVRYLAVFWPPLAESSLSLVLAAVALLWGITLLNLRGARAAGEFQVVTTLVKLVPLAAIVLLLAQLGAKGDLAASAHPHTPFDAGQLASAVTLAFFAMVGFECAGVAAERVRDPARTIPRATLTGVGLTGLLYLIACSGIIFAMPQGSVAGANAPVALFVETFWGHWAGLAVAGFAAVAAIGALNGWVLLQGEVPLGMARAGVIPARIGRTSGRDVPVAALLASSVLASVLVLSNVSRDTAAIYDFMLRVTTAATLWFYAGTCLSALVLGVVRPAAAIGLVFALWAIWGAGYEAIGLSLLLMATAIPLYLMRGSAEQAAKEAAIP